MLQLRLRREPRRGILRTPVNAGSHLGNLGRGRLLNRSHLRHGWWCILLRIGWRLRLRLRF